MSAPIWTWDTKAALIGWALVGLVLIVGAVLRELGGRKRKPDVRLPHRRGPQVLTAADLYASMRMGERAGYDRRGERP